MSGAEVEAIRFLFGSANSIIKHYSVLISSAESELQGLKKDLELLVEFVNDRTHTGVNFDNTTELFKKWMNQIKQVVWDVEDVIVDYGNQAETDKYKNVMFKAITCGDKIVLAEKVRYLRDKVKRVFDKAHADFVNLPKADNSTGPEITRRRNKVQRPNNFICLRQETDTLIDKLIAESERLNVFSIVGMPGIGKTTLAWHIHEDTKIRMEFPTIIWLSISQELNVKEMLLTMLKELEEIDFSTKEVEELEVMVHKHLRRGKFLIVLDDLWHTSDWDKVKKHLPAENVKQAKVLITTRIGAVSRYATERDVPDLRCLNYEESWELLKLEVFGSGVECPRELVEVGEELAGQCKGIPLAIELMGASLRHLRGTSKKSFDVKKEWRKFSLLSHQEHGSGQNHEEESLSRRILQSYKHLSYELKDCFMYLGVFPEDIEISVWKLTQLWIAEGFIHEGEHENSDEIAKRYLDALIDYRLLKVAKTKLNGDVKAVRVHDFIRDFCKTKDLHIFQEIKLSKEQDFMPELKKIEDCRYICIHSSVEKFLSENPKFLKARSFLSFSKESTTLKKNQLESISTAFNLLRILDVSMSIKFSEFPNKLAKLILLKYVTLSCEKFKVLPKEIYKLWNVQTLEVYTSLPTLIVNANIWKMTRLRHLKTKASIIMNKDGSGQGGDKLHTLNKLSPESCTNEVLSKAKSLKALGIRGKLNQLNASNCCFEEMENLRKLKLVHDLPGKEADQNPMFLLPESNWFPKNLEVLVLSGTSLNWDHMITLAQIVTLEVLKLKANAFKGDLWNAGKKCIQGFKSLHTLHISETNLKFWGASGETFPELRELMLENCRELQRVPDNVVRRLELLYMDGVSEYAVNSARKIEKEIELVQGAKTGKIGGFQLEIVPGNFDI